MKDFVLVRPVSGVQSHLPLGPTVRRLRPCRCTRADVRARRTVKQERGSMCELCDVPFPLEQLFVHHILETRIYPEFARGALEHACAMCALSLLSHALRAFCRVHCYALLLDAFRNRQAASPSIPREHSAIFCGAHFSISVGRLDVLERPCGQKFDALAHAWLPGVDKG
ncbi:MAG: hypothetical protein QOF24_602 [Verrucomicrobiota bacterium]|jgi:hypothetical protein